MPASNSRSRNGCHRCRTRKIKCDETQPKCERCQSAGFDCPGYKSPTEIVFRSMNQKVEHKVAWKQAMRVEKRAKEAVATLPVSSKLSGSSSSRSLHFRPWESSDESEDSSQSPTQMTIISRRVQNTNPPLCAPMSNDWGDPSICRFFSDYVVEANEVTVSPGYLNFLPKLYGEGTDEILTQSVAAVSLANFSNRVRSDDLLVHARKLYGKALLLVKRALSNPKQVTKDGTLASVFALNMYEMISGDKPMISQYGTHADALSMLLRLRINTDQFTSERSGGIARGAHGIVVFKNLLRRIPPGPESEAWTRSINPDELWAQVGLATIRIAKLIPMADEVLSEASTADGNGFHLLQTINMLEAEDRSFETWTEACQDPPYSYGKIDASVLLVQGNRAGIPLPEVVHYYHDVWITGFWNVYRFARIILMQTLAQLTTRVSLFPELAAMNPRMIRIREKVSTQVDAMVNDICASIPYTLGKVDANGWTVLNPPNPISMKAISCYTSVWPLKLAFMVKTLSETQKKYIFDQLTYIEGSMGIRQAKPNI